MTVTDETVNISLYIRHQARTRPDAKAVIIPVGKNRRGRFLYRRHTFHDLDQASDQIAHGLNRIGIRRGTRTILMVKPSFDFFALTYALFKTGAVPVAVDPGMGIRRMVACYRSTQPEAFIGIPPAHVIRTLFPNFFKTVTRWVTVGQRWFWRGHTLDQLRRGPQRPYEIEDTRQDDLAAIMFTTGSTGPAKGVHYTHGTFDAQVRHIGQHFEIQEGEVDLPTFPLFAIFDPALGMTAVIPKMDPTRPARVNPDHIFAAIRDQQVTNMFGSPALLNRVARRDPSTVPQLATVRRVVSAGAPVPPATIERFKQFLPPGTPVHTPYGATESFPIASVTDEAILGEARTRAEQGFGILIGGALEGLTIRIIGISDGPIARWQDDLLVTGSEIGEIVVRGDLVTAGYHQNPKADRLSKIADGDGFWHRMGDLGRWDENGRLWFCGRKNHRVTQADRIWYSICCEAIYNQHPWVFRSALVGVETSGHQKPVIPVICLELEAAHRKVDRAQLVMALQLLGRAHPHTRDIDTFLFHKAFPVDIRHNSKIFREKLAVWAGRQMTKQIQKGQTHEPADK